MSRIVKDWTREAVDGCTVAPHRYTWEATDDVAAAATRPEARKAAPYQAGDIVWIKDFDRIFRARIYMVTVSRDRLGELREAYKVQPETAAGYWSKVWQYTYPGYIQRGYQARGLAPELPESINSYKTMKADHR